MKNVGKIFEEQLKKSAPPYSLLYRLPDAAQSFGGSNLLRFSAKNPFDFLLWDSVGHILFALEAKTVSGKSISFERTKDEHGEIHSHQIKGLNDWQKYDGIMVAINKKSFTLKDLEDNNIPYFVIPQKKARTRFTYDLDYFMAEMRKN